MLYTDPGSGALLWQVLVAGIIGASFYIRKILGVFKGNAAKTITEAPKQDRTEGH